MLAHYRCQGCGLEYEDKPGIQADCPRCGGAFFEWVNFKEWQEWNEQKQIRKTA